ncbi:hypothetical protein [Mesobacillus harenae]|uniref:hypothetical protein n=1 Tax=Mesobacillus harenae TaxID=2213203 RepID=UPI001580ACCB|nr:hypothetical protein [Mesobacillus harenae]
MELDKEKRSRLNRNAETGESDQEAVFASAGGVEVSEFLGGAARQKSGKASSAPKSGGGPEGEVAL